MTPIRTTLARTPRPAFPPLTTRRSARLMADDTGSATAEYAIATMATVVQYWHTYAMTTPTVPRVGIYVRQSVREDQGIAQQIAECEAHARGKGWQVIDTYRDNNTSATKARGAGTAWARMLADIDSGRIDTVLSVTAARLLRRTEDVLEVTGSRRTVQVVTIRDGIDTATMAGRMMLTMLVLIAEAEIEEKEGRAIPYRAARREAGHPTAGRVPYGYAWVPDLHRDERGTRYRIVPAEAEVIRRMSSELLAGASLGAIVRALNDDGVTTRTGSRWRSSTARRILISPFQAALLPPPMPEGTPYKADRFTLSQCSPGAWEPILTADEVSAARGRLLDASRRSHDGDTRARWMLSGLGRCGKCGGPIRSARTNGVRMIRCTAGCFVRPAAPIEEYVEGAIIDVLSAPGLLTWIDDGGHSLDALRTRREALTAQRMEAEGLYRTRKLSAVTFTEMVDEIDAERAQIDADLAEALAADPLSEFLTVDDVRTLWDAMSMGRRRAVLGALLQFVHVHPVGKGRSVRTMEDTAGTVTLGWRHEEHRVSFSTGETTTTRKAGVPVGAEDAIVSALGAS